MGRTLLVCCCFQNSVVHVDRGRRSGRHAIVLIILGCCTLAVRAETSVQGGRDWIAILADTNAIMNLTASDVVSLRVPADVGRPLSVIVPIEGAMFTLDLQPASVRGDAHEVKIEVAPGVYHTINPPPSKTLRGSVEGIDGSVVAGSLGDEGLIARINFPDGRVFWMEPIGSRVPSARKGDYVVYRGDKVIPSEGACIELHPPAGAVAGEDVESSGSVAAGGLFFAELAVDVDFEYLQRFQGEPDPIAAVIENIESIINTVNAPQYETEVAIRHIITTMIIREFEPDPYPRLCVGGTNHNEPCTEASNCPGGGSCPFVGAETLLNQFRDEWLTQQSGVSRDVAQLFTGKELSGSTIGIAWLRAVCSSNFGYSVVQPGCCPTFPCKTDLSAHELGHNWGALHIDCSEHIDCSTCTMNASLRCVNTFCPISIDTITNFRDTRPAGCLDLGDELRRLTVSAASTVVSEGASVQFSAEADFLFGEDLDVTEEVAWTSEPPEAGAIDAMGLFTASQVDGNFCVTVTATFEVFGEIHVRSKTILVEDLDVAFAMASSDPQFDTVDARQPSNPDGTFPIGIRSIDLTFTGDVCFLTDFDFTATQLGGILSDPSIASTSFPDSRTVRVLLSRDIEPGAWTSIIHDASETRADIGYLPGDVTGNGFVGPEDILALVDALGDESNSLRAESSDIDRSGRLAPADLLRLIDLFNGSDRFAEWYLSSLP